MTDLQQEELVLGSTQVREIPGIVARLRAGFRSQVTLDYEYRVRQLRNLRRLIDDNEERLLEALYLDLNKPKMEAYMTEVAFIHNEIAEALNNLADWMAPKHQPRDLLNKFNSVYVQPEPYGVVLTIVPWNYPMQLVLSGLVGIVAAGNCCIVKPSEFAVAFSNLMVELIPKYLDPECYAVVSGALEQSQALLKERMDFIMFTGSPIVGKIVMKEAAATLTPVLLELGGKSPVIVASDANLEVAGRRIMWGKCVNSGQTCVAPDYVLCMKGQRDKLVEACKKAVKEFYGENPKESSDYCRMINLKHFQRVKSLIESSKGMVAYGGDSDPQSKYIQPTIVIDVTPEDSLMQEELFGPVLPILTVDSLDEAIDFVNEREKPLAMYVFTESRQTFERINKLVSAGGVTHNNVLLHFAVLTLPQGGVGNSGVGKYRGKHSFTTFSHLKAVVSTGTKLEFMNSVIYPPYTPAKYNRIRWLMRKLRPSRPWSWRSILLFLSVVAIAAVVQRYGLFTRLGTKKM